VLLQVAVLGLLALGGCAAAGTSTAPGGAADAAVADDHRVLALRGARPRSLSAGDLQARAMAAAVVVETDTGRGLGFVIDGRGHVLTNRHVIEDAARVVAVHVHDGPRLRSYAAVEVRYIDPARDLALLQVALDHAIEPLPFAAAGQTPAERYLAPHDPVVLVERVEELPGIARIVAHHAEVERLGVVNPLAGPGAFVGLRFDVREGQSGGPVLDRYGRAVGVVTWTWKDQGGGYVIPIADAAQMLAERPRLAEGGEQRARAELRARAFLRAVETGEVHGARELTSPSWAREVRGPIVARIMDAMVSSRADAVAAWFAALDAIAREALTDGPELSGERMQALVERTGSPEFLAAVGLSEAGDPVEPLQVMSFFLELSRAYLGARGYAGLPPQEALEHAMARLRTLEAARTFALAEALPTLAGKTLEVADVAMSADDEGPTARVRVRLRAPASPSDQRPATANLYLRLEWGDFYVADVREL
jgi:S1-C subfamily serine protease